MRSMYFVGLGILMTILFACKKDEVVSNCAKLEGIWQCESWKENTVQLLGTTAVFDTAEINFKVLTGDQGDYLLNKNFLIGGPEMTIGAYVVNQDCTQVTLTPKGGGPGELYNFHFEGGVLILDGTINTVVKELQFKKE